MSFLQNPYVFGILIALATATLVYGYQHTIDTDPESKKKTFYKTLAAGTVSAIGLAYFIHRPQPLSNEPFMPEAPVATAATTTTV